MEKKRISRILARARDEAVKALAEEIMAEHTPLIIKAPKKSLVMIRMQEPVEESLFYLGEVMVSESIVDIEGVKGMAVLMGDHYEKVLHMAIIDGACNKGVFKRYGLLETWEKEQREAMEKENAMFMQTMVNFQSMDTEETE